MADSSNSRMPAILWSLSCLLVVGAIVGGLVLTGGPGHQRKKQLDRERIQDLHALKQEIVDYYTTEKTLPESLDDLQWRYARADGTLADPVSGAPYEYRATGKERFDLCAVFETDTMDEERHAYPRGSIFDYDARHPAGRQCYEFARKADPHSPNWFEGRLKL